MKYENNLKEFTTMPVTSSLLRMVTSPSYDLRDLDLPDIRTSGLMDPCVVLSRTSDGYTGTYSLLLDAAVEDLLSDGPLIVSIKIEEIGPRPSRVTGYLVGAGDGEVVIATMAEGLPVVVAVDREDIIHFEF